MGDRTLDGKNRPLKIPRRDKKGRIFWEEENSNFVAWAILLCVIAIVVINVGFMVFGDHQLIIYRPYAVYRPDPQTTAKLEDCQTDWQSDQITKKLLRIKIKRLEAQ